jgi:molybdopterin converting factor small subunit
MDIEVSFLSLLSDVTGVKKIKVSIEKPQIQLLFDKISERFGSEVRNRLFSNNGGLNHQIFIVINNETIEIDKLNEVVLKSNDNVILLPAIAGG